MRENLRTDFTSNRVTIRRTRSVCAVRGPTLENPSQVFSYPVYRFDVASSSRVRKQLTGWTHFRIGSARWAAVAFWAHPVGAESLPGLAVRHGIRRAELAEVSLRAQDVRCRQARIVAGRAGRTEGAVRAVGLSRDGVIRPMVTVVSLGRRLRRGRTDEWRIMLV